MFGRISMSARVVASVFVEHKIYSQSRVDTFLFFLCNVLFVACGEKLTKEKYGQDESIRGAVAVLTSKQRKTRERMAEKNRYV